MTLPAGWSAGPAPASADGFAAEPITIRHPEPPLVLSRTFAPALAPAWYRLDLAFAGAGMADARVVLVLADGGRLPQRLPKIGRNRFVGLYRADAPLAGIALELSGSTVLDAPEVLSWRPVSRWERRRGLLRRAAAILAGDPRSFPWRAARFLIQVRRGGAGALTHGGTSAAPARAYALWRERFDERDDEGHAFQRTRTGRLTGRPLFSVIADPEQSPADLAALRASLDRQVYARWELLAPGGADPGDARVRSYGNGRATRLEAGIAAGRGDFMLLPRTGTLLRPHTLLTFAATLDRHRDAKLIYADDDDLNAAGLRAAPRFKPAWSPARLASFDYVGDPCCIAAEALRALGPPAGTGAAAQRHDLRLRLSEVLAQDEVVHVAQILSHAAAPPPAATAAAAAESEAVVRRHVDRLAVPGRVVRDPRSPHPRILFEASEPPLVSVIVPTRDRADLLRMSVGSVRGRTRYPSVEIVVVDNGSRDPATLRLFEGWAGDAAIRVLRDDRPFNYAALNNAAVAASRGAVLCLLNNDVDVTGGDWLDAMVGLALRPGVGCVGAKLFYPDGRLQHGGVATGVAGAAGHRNKRAARGARGNGDDLVTVNEVSAVTAACLVVRKDLYLAVGGLDERVFAVAYNDVDFCLKVARAGYRNLWTPFAELTHHESVSRGRDLTARAAERFARETLALRLRWGARLLADPYYSPNLTVDAENGAIRTT